MFRRVLARAAAHNCHRVPTSLQHTKRIFSSASRPLFSSFQPPPSSFSPKPDDSLLQDAVDHFNAALKDHTAITFGVMVASDMTAVFSTYALLQLSGVVISPEFALAFAASRPLRRLRMPLDIAAAAFLAKYFPALTTVKISTMMPALPTSDPKAGASSFLHKGLSGISSIMDKYGAAYMMGSRLMGLTVVSSLYLALSQGLDILPILEQYGMGDVGAAVGTWAAAVALSSLFYPITLGATGYIVPVVAKLVKSKPPTRP
ncbi:Aste57867_25122 [Aphanomyces stellatus]|uniref:Aste57867_25122 protein n=1 Tax=Aphanomyces stellatus TaxID=120398 RepID=A0A485LSC0_9STRA|nr:hypothetical protein As57867_025044 [Aphanomyces stellatus]VFU01753.1 Aste57867_25122 [Aphanomyces stellatus]